MIRKITPITFFCLVLIELFSLLASRILFVNIFFSLLIFILVLFLAITNLKYGLLIAFSELIIGGFGYLFWIPVGEYKLSIRMLIFLAIMIATVIQVIRNKKIVFFEFESSGVYLFFALILMISCINGFLKGNLIRDIFLDMNAFLFMFYIIPVYEILPDKEKFVDFIYFLRLPVIFLIVKSIIFFILFTSGVAGIGDFFYKWIRDSRVGEITNLGGGIYRVFLQSQIYLVLYFILDFFSIEKKQTNIYLSFSNLAVILLSMSRSFWLGLFLTAVSFGVYFLLKSEFKLFLINFWFGLKSLVLALFLICFLFLFFHSSHNPALTINIFQQRSSIQNDISAKTRWSEISPLLKKIREKPILGSGFGSKLEFVSFDPRQAGNNSSQKVSTFSFEWGFLDFAYKTGLLGVLFYLYFLFKLIYKILSKKVLASKKNKFDIPVSATILALIIIHFFTPYLNHPLGLGWLIIVQAYSDI